ncbi:MAG: WbqC family protein, partial [Pyrinomonadaceae bacterium]
VYLCGGGAAEYQDEKMFYDWGLSLKYQKFEHPTYHQIGNSDFVPGLSVLDALMNCGRARTSRLLRHGER